MVPPVATGDLFLSENSFLETISNFLHPAALNLASVAAPHFSSDN
jgi:hypothetical protein